MTPRTPPDSSRPCRGAVIACSCPSRARGHSRPSRPRARRPPVPATTDTSPTSRWRRLAWTGVAVATVVAASAAARALLSTRSRPGAAARERGHRPAGRLVHPQSVAGHISRQSIHRVSGLHRDGRRGLLMRPLGSGAAHALPLTEDGSDPFWAPDSATIGFFAEGKLKMLPVRRRARPHYDRDAPADSGGTFLSPGIVLFGPGPAGTIMQVDVERGTLRTVTTLDAGAGDRRHVRPMAVPDRPSLRPSGAAQGRPLRNARVGRRPTCHRPRLRGVARVAHALGPCPVRARWNSAGSEARPGRRTAGRGCHDTGSWPHDPRPRQDVRRPFFGVVRHARVIRLESELQCRCGARHLQSGRPTTSDRR